MIEKYILKIENRDLGYSKDNIILRNVNLNIYENDFLGIIGPNGGGKSTLIKSILGLLPYNTGREIFFKNEKETPKLNIGYLPQINLIDKQFPIGVFDTIISGIKLKKTAFRYTEEQKSSVYILAEKMGIVEYLNQPIGKLSGGQLQRVLLARSIIDQPDLLILDEPNTFVDKKFESFFYEFLSILNLTTAIIMVSHDISTTLRLVKNIACINNSVHYHSGNEVSNEWLRETYNCPIDLITHGNVPHRVLASHDDCECCKHNEE